MANEKRMIDAKPLMEDGWHLVKTGKSNVFLASMSLADVPTVNAVEVVHGKWENIRFITTGDGRAKVGDCSSCKSIERVRNYCPNCGAKMDGGNEDGR